MTLAEIIRGEAKGNQLRELAGLAALSAAANTYALAVIMRAVRAPEELALHQAFTAVVALLLYSYVERYVTHSSLGLLEAALHRIRARIGAKLIRADLEVLERVEVSEICNRLTEGLRRISAHSNRIPAALQAAILMVFLIAYIGTLSLETLTLLSLLIVIGLGLFLNMRREYVRSVLRTQRLRVGFLSRVFDVFDGFEQLQFSAQARRDLHAEIGVVAEELHASSVHSSKLSAENRLIGGGLGHALLGGVAFVVGAYVELDGREFAQLIALALFLRRPVTTLSFGLLPLLWTDTELATIAQLEARLEGQTRVRNPAGPAQDPWTEPPRRLRLAEIAYSYPSEDSSIDPSFALGPLSLDFERGKLVFIVGGNGSGKSTLFKLMAALYQPSQGALELDGVSVGPENVAAYRERVSAVFGDFHLFERLYGMPELDPAEVHRRLEEFGLRGVVDFVDGQFTTLELSTGQRKRLALVVALLEDRPILLLDEWAAEQDPPARRRFYEQQLPRLRDQGKIVIAISHDDHYFEMADAIVTLDRGRVRAPEGAP